MIEFKGNKRKCEMYIKHDYGACITNLIKSKDNYYKP